MTKNPELRVTLEAFKHVMANQERVVQEGLKLQEKFEAMISRFDNEEKPPPQPRARKIKVEVSSFDGSFNEKIYFKWEKSLEKYFVVNEIMDDNEKYKIAKAKLKGEGDEWLQRVQRCRAFQGQISISSWRKLKRMKRNLLNLLAL